LALGYAAASLAGGLAAVELGTLTVQRLSLTFGVPEDLGVPGETELEES
jgi:hypothetical protein